MFSLAKTTCLEIESILGAAMIGLLWLLILFCATLTLNGQLLKRGPLGKITYNDVSVAETILASTLSKSTVLLEG